MLSNAVKSAAKASKDFDVNVLFDKIEISVATGTAIAVNHVTGFIWSLLEKLAVNREPRRQHISVSYESSQSDALHCPDKVPPRNEVSLAKVS